MCKKHAFLSKLQIRRSVCCDEGPWFSLVKYGSPWQRCLWFGECDACDTSQCDKPGVSHEESVHVSGHVVLITGGEM